MKIKTIQWNIGGGKIRKKTSDPQLVDSYKEEGLAYIIKILKAHNPDIITLQETHSNGSYNQAQKIAKALGLNYFYNDVYDKSHLEEEMGLGQAIISKFPLTNHKFTFFHNPKFTKKQESGVIWTTHNKGATTVKAKIDKYSLQLITLHLIPFRKFDISLDDAKLKKVKQSIIDNISINNSNGYLLQGDFNVDNSSLTSFLPSFVKKVKEVILDSPTTPKGRKYDHIIYRSIDYIKSDILSNTLTDHYPIISEFEVK